MEEDKYKEIIVCLADQVVELKKEVRSAREACNIWFERCKELEKGAKKDE